ncbi:MAG: Hsp20/alpha crystallin family protein [Gammaproteobacteria bacterium]|jgi:HSP20 family protein
MYNAHYEPLRLFDQFNGGFRHRLANASRRHASMTAGWIPAVDIRETDDGFTLAADLPGVDRKDVVITVDDGVLTFQGERASETRGQDAGYRRRERASGKFLRRFSLPDGADSDNISATVTNGVLEIRIPWQQKLRAKKITVN